MQEATLVTGGGSSIGLAIVERMEAEGQKLIVLDKVPPKEMRDRVFEPVDLSDADATKAALQRVCGEYRVTRLVNNVAICNIVDVEDETVENLRRTVAVNLRCALLCMQAVLPAMTEAKFGRVVNLSSRAAFGKERRLAYNATKGGINTVTRTWALEFATRGITVNAVGPGVTETDMYRQNNPPDSPLTRKTNSSIPMRRLGQPADIAEAVAFFLDKRNSYITGQLLFVCGGLSIGTQPVPAED